MREFKALLSDSVKLEFEVLFRVIFKHEKDAVEEWINLLLYIYELFGDILPNLHM